MCLSTEAVAELHSITSAIKAEQEKRDGWIQGFDAAVIPDAAAWAVQPVEVTRAEAERIFADRIAAHEKRLGEIGWSHKVRVETTKEGA